MSKKFPGKFGLKKCAKRHGVFDSSFAPLEIAGQKFSPMDVRRNKVLHI